MRIAFLLLLGTCGAVCAQDRAVYIVDNNLCSGPIDAIRYAGAIANGQESEMAKDVAGRAAGAEVCGRYVGKAVISSQREVNVDGQMYRLTEFKFEDARTDRQTGWIAESVFDIGPGGQQSL
jgi:hypothetical protein